MRRSDDIHGETAGVDEDQPAEDNICQPCKEPDTFEGLVDSFCRAGAVFRVTVDSVNAENGYLRVNFMRKKRAYKRGTLVKKEIRKLVGYIPVTNKCDCAKNNASLIAPKKRLLVMGRMEQDKFLLFFVSPYQRKSEGFRAATKMWKKENPCKSWAIPDVYTPEKTEKKEKNKTDKKRDKKDKKNRKKKKRRRKKKGSKKRNKDRKKSKKGNEVSPPSQ
ncbi:uncharacterized protein LOC128250721 [Octopus bimaculoides]|nr:uncharacterized protein LOC128250721 [Octopus bimaculoides]